MADLQRIQRLVEDALENFDEGQSTTSHILRRCIRVAKLRNDYSNLLWLELEARDISIKEPIEQLGPDILLHLERDEAEELFQRAYKGYLARRGTEGGKFVPFSVEQLERHISRLHEALEDLTVPEGLHPVDLYHRSAEVTKMRTDLRLALKSPEDVLLAIRGRLHTFLVQTEQQLDYGQVNADVFDRTRVAVDEQLSRIAPEALEKFRSAYNRVREGEPESLSQALTSCRRILKAVADAVYPATGEVIASSDNSERAMSEEKYLNRILQAVSDALGKHGEGPVITATLKSLGERLKALDNLASKGVHADVSPGEVDTCVIQTYLMVGDVLRVVSNSSGLLLSTGSKAELAP